MLKRVFAWILLLGFVFLLLNIMVFHFYVIPSVSIYLMIAIWFIFSNKSMYGAKTEKSFEEDQNSKVE